MESISSNDKIFNLPNKLTLFRIFLIPVFIVVLYFDMPITNKLATLIFAIASITDFVDGYIARKYQLITSFGKILDPIADKILVAAALIVLVDMDRLSAVLVIILLSREFVIGALRDYASSEGIIIPAGWYGKVKTTLQMLAIGFLIYKDDLWNMPVTYIGNILIYSSVIISIYSAVIYYIDFFKLRNE
jgi:CDP-diacylglycerol--glycerol-3-phosphate 3-phosphatidyltransferase/cardiolipin synthase